MTQAQMSLKAPVMRVLGRVEIAVDGRSTYRVECPECAFDVRISDAQLGVAMPCPECEAWLKDYART